MASTSRITTLAASIGLVVGPLLGLIGFLTDRWIWFGPGLMLQLASVVWLLTRHEEQGPLSLSEQVRSAIGPLGKPQHRVTLVDPGQRKAAVVRCLRDMYGAGLGRGWSLIRDAPSVLGTAVSKEEADFVASRLAECGAKVDVVGVIEEDHVE